MKKIIIAFLFVFIAVQSVRAQTPSASPSADVASPTLSPVDKEVQTFKDKVATKVAELREENNRAVAGTVTSNDGTTVKFKTVDDTDYEAKIDDALTNYFQINGTDTTEIKLTDIKKGDYIIVDGVINDKSITTNSIYVDELLMVLTGRVIQVNTDFSISVLGNDKETYTLDIQNSTKQYMLNTDTLQEDKIGFSKIKEGDTIHFVVQKTGNEKEANRYDALKLLIIPQEYFIK